MIFFYIIGKVVGTRSPKTLELILSFMAVEPVVLHVDGFGFVLDDGVISKSNCGGIITLNGIFCLRPTHIDKGMTKLDRGFSADEEARNFVFGAEEIIVLIIWGALRTGPFLVGTGVSSESMMWAPERLQDFLTLR